MDHELALAEAIKSGHREDMIDLIDKYPDLLDSRLEGQISPVLLAMYYNEPELAQWMIAAGAALDVFSAAAVNNWHTLQDILVSQPFLVNAFAPDGFQPLGLAAFFGAQDAVQLLLQMGAEVNSTSHNDFKVAPLHSAVANQHYDIARILLANGADVNARQADGFTPLHGAAQNGQLEMVQLLCQFGAVKDSKNDDGLTPQDIAQNAAHQRVVEFLSNLLY